MWKERRPDSSTARGGMYGSILTALRRWLTSSIGWRRGCPGERCSKPTDSRLESHAHAALGAEARPDDRADERLFGYRLNRPRTSSTSASSARHGRRVSASFTRPRTATGSSAANRVLPALATIRSASCVTVKPLASNARIAGTTVLAAAMRSTPSVRTNREGTRIPAAGQPPAEHSTSGSPRCSNSKWKHT